MGRLDELDLSADLPKKETKKRLERTGTEWAPWHLVEGDSTRFARVKVLETVIAAAEDGHARHGRMSPPGA